MLNYHKKYRVPVEMGMAKWLVAIDSVGSDLKELLANAVLVVIDTEHCETLKANGDYFELSDLPQDAYEHIEQDMASAIQDSFDHQAELNNDRLADIRAMNKGEA